LDTGQCKHGKTQTTKSGWWQRSSKAVGEWSACTNAIGEESACANATTT
jgi:hypothetical protein